MSVAKGEVSRRGIQMSVEKGRGERAWHSSGHGKHVRVARLIVFVYYKLFSYRSDCEPSIFPLHSTNE